MRRLWMVLFLSTVMGAAQADEMAHPVQADASGLPALGTTWRETNPYRGHAAAAQVGQNVFAQACARCHGNEADGVGVAPDLRRIDLACRPIADAALKARCQADVDDYFRRSVLLGKTRVGIVHMPPWQGFLSQEQVWAVRTYIESRAR